MKKKHVMRCSCRNAAVVRELKKYYLPQLKFSMNQHRKFAKDCCDDDGNDKGLYNGAANAFEIAIGCIEEALELLKLKKDKND